MLQDESLEYIREQYDEKNIVLGQFGEQVSAATFYEDIFDDTTMKLPIVIIDDDEEKRIRVMSIEDAVSFSAGRNDVLIGGCSYFNNWISKKSAKDIYTFIVDYDNAYSGVLLKALQDDWKSANGEAFAKPTYIVNSGTGLHLYFVLSEPIPNYHSMTEQLDKVYRALAIQQSRRVYVKRQVQWFGQDFRMAGGLNKYEWENTIFRVGEKWDIDELARAVGIPDIHFIRYGEKRKKKPQQQKQKKKVNRQGWKTNRAFYDYSLNACREKTKEGNRYTSMCALSVIAWKCGVSQEELEEDLLSLLPSYNKGATRQVKEKEVYSALKMYNEKAMLTQRQSLEHWQGWEYKPIKRNGRKQEQHLQFARGIKNLKKQMGEEVNEGRPKGKSEQSKKIEEWRKANPNGTKAQCIRETGISKPTVYRWWEERK